MILCEYGCGNEAKHQLKNGKRICLPSPNSCPVKRKKNSEITKKTNRFALNASQIEATCKWCNHISTKSALTKHQKFCYMNPDNAKICPVCYNLIKNWKDNATCSSKCARDFYSDKYKKYARKNKKLRYRTICFDHHKKECVVCGEKHIVEVHHYDNNHKNNKPTNFIPLCPTHHTYMRSKYKHLIVDQVEKYHKRFCIRSGIEKKQNLLSKNIICPRGGIW